MEVAAATILTSCAYHLMKSHGVSSINRYIYGDCRDIFSFTPKSLRFNRKYDTGEKLLAKAFEGFKETFRNLKTANLP